MSTLETTIPNPSFFDPDNLAPWTEDCGAGEITLANGEEWLLDPDEYHCISGEAKGSGAACRRCELRWAWHQLDLAAEALRAAGIDPDDVYPEVQALPPQAQRSHREMMPEGIVPTSS